MPRGQPHMHNAHCHPYGTSAACASYHPAVWFILYSVSGLGELQRSLAASEVQ